MKLRAVIFDMGGVLAHDVWEHLLMDTPNGVAARFGLPRHEVEQEGKRLWKIYECPPQDLKSKCPDLEQHYWNAFIARFKEYLPTSITPNDFKEMTDPFIRGVNHKEMVPLLESLKSRGVSMVICSNNNEFWFRRQMKKLNLYRFFGPHNWSVSFEVGFPKSSPGFEMFDRATAILGIDKGSCLFIDDRKDCINLALQYGITSVIFPAEGEYGPQYLRALLQQMSLL